MAEEGDGPQLVFLGTGASEPMKYRGASSVYLGLPSGKGFLLDAGEAAWGQLLRFFGPQEAAEKVHSLHCFLPCLCPFSLRCSTVRIPGVSLGVGKNVRDFSPLVTPT